MKWWTMVLSSWGIFVMGLFISTAVGQTVSHAGYSEPLVHALQAVLLAFIVLPSLYWLLKKSNNRPFLAIGLSSVKRAVPRLISGAGLVVFLTGSGFAIAEWLGWIRITEFHISMPLIAIALLNVVVAFFYEAFPEELTFRGAVYSALSDRFGRIFALFLQPVVFVLAPVTVSGLHLIAGFEAAAITLDYVILLVTFGSVLQLLRLVTNSLWTSIGFHLTYLFSSRFIVLQREARFFTYDEIEPGTGELFIIFMMTLLLGIVILISVAVVRKLTTVRHNKEGCNHV
ncbi:CPBP family intramembrane metalloprotease domain-containing protein [Paenibacillus elgii]|uniref:CPBP family intramembrane metalloprotease domain-containing protein n=2 Tax=Paenibacillus elgii TaxID=189691 RepID=A0A2T6G7T5_9BACL|nr:CPBP family intramembrane glutamic endopeptidase [Paenibacillus elgii]PUA40211.1 CPBP family intramembrane metalloprotease domain-containing protein [Paenibacillus elgii]